MLKKETNHTKVMVYEKWFHRAEQWDNRQRRNRRRRDIWGGTSQWQKWFWYQSVSSAGCSHYAALQSPLHHNHEAFAQMPRACHSTVRDTAALKSLHPPFLSPSLPPLCQPYYFQIFQNSFTYLSIHYSHYHFSENTFLLLKLFKFVQESYLHWLLSLRQGCVSYFSHGC